MPLRRQGGFTAGLPQTLSTCLMLPICVNTLTSGGFATAREAAQHLHNDEVIQGRKDLAAELDVWPPDAKLLKDTI